MKAVVQQSSKVTLSTSLRKWPDPNGVEHRERATCLGMHVFLVFFSLRQLEEICMWCQRKELLMAFLNFSKKNATGKNFVETAMNRSGRDFYVKRFLDCEEDLFHTKQMFGDTDHSKKVLFWFCIILAYINLIIPWSTFLLAYFPFLLFEFSKPSFKRAVFFEIFLSPKDLLRRPVLFRSGWWVLFLMAFRRNDSYSDQETTKSVSLECRCRFTFEVQKHGWHDDLQKPHFPLSCPSHLLWLKEWAFAAHWQPSKNSGYLLMWSCWLKYHPFLDMAHRTNF